MLEQLDFKQQVELDKRARLVASIGLRGAARQLGTDPSNLRRQLSGVVYGQASLS
jgi:hypothetical protein